MKICVIGSGYVGLVTGTCLAEMGNKVWCVDVDQQKIDKLRRGVIPIYEPGLEELVRANVKEKRLMFTTDLAEGIEKALYVFIAVGTPPGEDGSADLTHVLGVARDIGRNINKYMIVVNKSTVPVGTAVKVQATIRKELTDRGLSELEFDVVSNPEFLKEGAAIEDFMRPDRVVIGVDNVRTAELMKQLYDPFVRNENPLIVMDLSSAELTKYAANAMLATRISFMNEVARLCDQVGADVNKVRVGIGTDKRIGMPFLYAGAGYGGSCFPKDVKELIQAGQRFDVDMALVKAVDVVNERQKQYLVDLINIRYENDIAGKHFAIWGLAFKPQTDDMREAPSKVVIEALLAGGAIVAAYDPAAEAQAQRILPPNGCLTYGEDMMMVLQDADALVLMTEWRQFRRPDFSEMKELMRTPVLFDGRNQYDPLEMKAQGFEYYCIGRNNRGK
ncbi:MAG TPA: UDP-glucose/GDP-mannose dehydrogenase family protein [Patescibacteria group bacterium]|nr:UDP-glucose/GDP-mannose dehydrogenase family protein [Patescibacteria group bacterium]